MGKKMNKDIHETKRQIIQKTYQGNGQQKKSRDKTYKKFRNKVVDLLKVSKHTRYKKFSKENKKTCKTLWHGIHETIYSRQKNIPSPHFHYL